VVPYRAAVAHRILVIEDDETIAHAVAERLRSEAFVVDVASDGLEGVAHAARVRPDLVVLDLMLPGLEGLEVCRRIQSAGPVPVLMLTARDDEADVIVGLAVGADDYLTKPFSPRELVARVRAILRRVEGPTAPSPVMQLGSLRIDQRRRRVWVAEGDEAHLTATEFDLLVALATQPESVRTRDQLLAEVWGYRDGSGARTVDSHIRALRRKLGDGWIRTVHGVGYAIEVPA
jgi:DNA-binding response OmpR family regulator